MALRAWQSAEGIQLDSNSPKLYLKNFPKSDWAFLGWPGKIWWKPNMDRTRFWPSMHGHRTSGAALWYLVPLDTPCRSFESWGVQGGVSMGWICSGTSHKCSSGLRSEEFGAWGWYLHNQNIFIVIAIRVQSLFSGKHLFEVNKYIHKICFYCMYVNATTT